MKQPIFKRLALIGIGLIGSSIARRVRADGSVGEITIATRSQETLDRAENLRLGDSYNLDARDAVKGADCVILCSPVGTYEAIAEHIAPALEHGAVVTDVGSVKQSVIDQMQPYMPEGVHFIPGHPIAGTEYSGPDAGFPSLFEKRWCILTPLPGADEAAVKKLSEFWRSMGSDIDIMEPEHHDLVLAVTSHIPHLIAYNIVGTASDLENVTESEVMKYAAGGFRDFTRIAASDPVMWRDVFLHNKKAVLEILGRFSEDLAHLQRAVRWENGDVLFDHFTRTRSIRRGIIEAGQETDEPDFGRSQQNQDD
ncbi:prephenate/arogenate dehydrogenase family protein [Pseudahrensia aquimaris]|uniref:Prephenate/arogenate dehydrogenase family protein n=1 Tax=Pseudahrensia aquimaris TaxID=744461 RepID=A0ABW3FC05_9HYPH